MTIDRVPLISYFSGADAINARGWEGLFLTGGISRRLIIVARNDRLLSSGGWRNPIRVDRSLAMMEKAGALKGEWMGLDVPAWR